MMRRLAVSLLLPLSVLLPAGQDPTKIPTPVAGVLEAAKADYRKEYEQARNLISKAFDEAEKKATDAADIAAFKATRAERDEFLRSGILPERTSTEAFQKQATRLQKTLDDAYANAIREYLKANKIKEAEAIQKERDEVFQALRLESSQQAVLRDPGIAQGFGAAIFGQGAETIQGCSVKVGDPQFTLIWDSKADLDLLVTDPSGKTIWWNSRKAYPGGLLDMDNTDGFGPENAAWSVTRFGELPQEGEYRWAVRYHGGNDGVPVTSRWRVRVKCAGKVSVTQGTLSRPRERSQEYSVQYHRVTP